MSEDTEKTEDTGAVAIPPKRVRVNLDLSVATHRALKLWCVKRGVTLQDGLESIVDRAFKDRVEP